jgi:adenylate kinase family enzyme
VTRIAVIGNGGGGKSTLSRTLAARLGIPHHEVDPVQYRSDWSSVPEEEVVAVLDGWLDEDAWIIDGFGPLPCIERRVAAADTVVWVDFPIRTHLWWAVKRQLFWRVTPDGRERPSTRRMLKTIWRVHQRWRPKFESAVRGHEQKLVVLRSPCELRRWLEDPSAQR